jgi:hypothetical protein
MLKRLWVVLVSAAALSGCAVGVKHGYDQTVLAPVSGSASVAVGVHDERPYVVSGNKADNFVGLSRGGFGNPFDVSTQSGNPLATDMGKAVTSSFEQGGFKAQQVVLDKKLSPQQAQETLLAAKTDRSVLLALVEWKSDTYQRVALLYDMRLTVLDPAGKQLAFKQLAGKDNLGDGGLNPPAYSKEAVPKAFRALMEGLFKDPEVAKALQK